MQTRISPPMPLPARGQLARLAVLLTAAALATGCATDPRRDGLSPHEFASVDHIAIHMLGEQPRHEYQILERIEGISCNLSDAPRNHPSHKVVTEYEALYDLKLEAADLGANAIFGVVCRRNPISYTCYDSIHCEGDAARLDDGVGMDLPLASMSALQARAASADYAGNTALYESLVGFTPNYLTESQRASLGEIGIVVPARAPGKTVEAPPSGNAALYQGAGLWFGQCVAGGGTIGLLISPLCAAIGAGLGALTAESEESVKASSSAIRSALEDFYSHEDLRERIVRVAAQSGAQTLTLPAASQPRVESPRHGDGWRFDDQVDSVIDIGVEELLLPAWRSGATTNLPSPVSVRTRVRVVRLWDSREIYNRSYGFVSERRLFREWGAQSGAALRHALETGFEQIAERIVEDLLLAYPLMPGFAITGTATNQRNYVVEPLQPPAHQYRFAGSAQASLATSLEPTFQWGDFPSETVLSADFQAKLRQLSALRYDLRIYRLDDQRNRARIVLERNNIEASEYRITQPLAPSTEYAWTVRARFALDTGERTTRWSGDWIGGGVRGFLFRTPDNE
jgi:hypothetical protein